MKNLGDFLKQAQGMQTRLAEFQDKLAAVEIEGSSGGGMVSVTLSGKGDMRRIRIEPGLIDSSEAGILEDLIVAAHSDAKSKVEAYVAEKMSELTGGMALPPGMKLPF